MRGDVRPELAANLVADGVEPVVLEDDVPRRVVKQLAVTLVGELEPRAREQAPEAEEALAAEAGLVAQVVELEARHERCLVHLCLTVVEDLVRPPVDVLEAVNLVVAQAEAAFVERGRKPRRRRIPAVNKRSAGEQARREEPVPAGICPLGRVLALLAGRDGVRVRQCRDGLVGLEAGFAPLGEGDAELGVKLPRDGRAEAGGLDEEGAVEELGEDEGIDERLALCMRSFVSISASLMRMKARARLWKPEWFSKAK